MSDPGVSRFALPRWNRPAVALGLIMVLGVFLRVWNLGAESAWLDEVLTLRHTNAASLGEFWQRIAQEDVSVLLVPVYYTLEYAWSRLFGDSLMAMRCLSLSAGVLSIPILFLLGRRLFGPAVGCFAALCLAFSLPHIFYSQEVRRYAFDTLLVLTSFYTLLRSVDHRPAPRRRIRWWTAHLLINGVLIWTTIYSLPMLLAEALFLWRPVRCRMRLLAAWAIFHGAVTLCLAVWIYRLNIQELFWIALPTPKELANAFLVFAGGRFSNDDPGLGLPLGISFDMLLAAGLYASIPCFLLQICRKREEDQQQAWIAAVLLIWLFLPPLTWYVFSYVWKPCFLYRYYLFCACALYLLAGAAWSRLSWAPLKVFVLVLLLILFGYQAAIRLQGPFRPDYRGAVAQIQAEPSTMPILILKERLNRLPLVYAYPFPSDQIHIAHGEGELHPEAVRLTKEYGQCWTVMWRWDRMDRFETILRHASLEFERIRLGGMPPLFLYRIHNAAPNQ